MIKTREELGFFITEQEIALALRGQEARRIKFLERRKIANDELLPIVDKKLGETFSGETYQDAKPYIDVSANVFKRVISEISTVYNREPSREISPKLAQKQYEAIIGVKGFDINSKFQKANYLLNGLNDLIFQVVVDEDYIDLGVLTPDRVIVFRNPKIPHLAEALMIEDSFVDDKGATITQWFFWSPVRHFVVRGAGKSDKVQIIGVVDNPEMKNPYAEINQLTGEFYPFVFCHSSAREENFFDENSGNDLVSATKSVCLQKTFKNMMIPMQFKQIAVQLPTDEGRSLKNNQLKSPLHVFQSNGEMTVLDWQSNIEELGRVIEQNIYEIATAYGVSPENFKLSSTATSGFARRVAKERLNEIREGQKKIWRTIEQDVFNAIRATTNLYPQFQAIPYNAKFNVDYYDMQIFEDPLIEMQLFEKKIELGLMSLVDVVKALNPDIESDARAEEILRKNIEARNRVRDRFGFSDLTMKGAEDGDRRKAIESRIEA